MCRCYWCFIGLWVVPVVGSGLGMFCDIFAWVLVTVCLDFVSYMVIIECDCGVTLFLC